MFYSLVGSSASLCKIRESITKENGPAFLLVAKESNRLFSQCQLVKLNFHWKKSSINRKGWAWSREDPIRIVNSRTKNWIGYQASGVIARSQYGPQIDIVLSSDRSKLQYLFWDENHPAIPPHNHRRRSSGKFYGSQLFEVVLDMPSGLSNGVFLNMELKPVF